MPLVLEIARRFFLWAVVNNALKAGLIEKVW